ncbi:TPA: DUF551 domain-containing protein [Klebsiella pneumoniae]
MTRSTITREESIQAVFDLKVGYKLGLADIEILKRVARMALATLASEPVAEVYQPQNAGICAPLGPSIRMLCPLGPGEKLYRHAQPAPVVPDDVLDALQKVARIRLDLNDFDGDRRGITDCLCDAEEALIEVVNRRAAMLAAAQQPPGSEPATVPGKWIPVSERMPERGDYLVTDGCDFDVQLFNGEQFIPGFVWEDKITHWMPLPAAPQGVIHG